MIPVRKCSCGFLMEVVATAPGAITYVCGHCDRKPCETKHCSLCRALQQADAHNTKS